MYAWISSLASTFWHCVKKRDIKHNVVYGIKKNSVHVSKSDSYECLSGNLRVSSTAATWWQSICPAVRSPWDRSQWTPSLSAPFQESQELHGARPGILNLEKPAQLPTREWSLSLSLYVVYRRIWATYGECVLAMAASRGRSLDSILWEWRISDCWHSSEIAQHASQLVEVLTPEPCPAPSHAPWSVLSGTPPAFCSWSTVPAAGPPGAWCTKKNRESHTQTDELLMSPLTSSDNTLKNHESHTDMIGSLLITLVQMWESCTHEVWRQVESVELVRGLEQVGHEVGHEHFLSQLFGGSSLAAGHLHAPLICVCDNADSLGDGLIQHRMLHNKKTLHFYKIFTFLFI